MNRNITNEKLSSSSDNHDMIVSSHRSSSRISSKEVPSARHQSSVRGGITKKNVSQGPRRSSKGTPKPRRKQKENGTDLHFEMEYSNNEDIDNLNASENHEDEEQNVLNISSASADTIIVGNSNNKKNLQKQPIEYFTFVTGSNKVKCSTCFRDYKYNQFSDSNLRSHLGFMHGLYSYLYPSQVKQRENHEKKDSILPHLKKELDTAAIECIVIDGLPFGTFRRPGMQRFLNTIKSGYRGPTRQTVRKHLDTMYQERRSSLKEKFKTIPFISLTTDLWMNSRRNHFLVITAHYYDENYQTFSNVISFRSFRGRHLASRLKKFILNEIKKLNIESKIFSITTDNGSDIKSATSSSEFGIRFSCDAHNINRTISTGLNLWEKPALKNKNGETIIVPPISSSSTTTTIEITASSSSTSNEDINNSDDELEKSRLVDMGVIVDEWVDYDENYLNDEDDGDADHVPTLADDDESDSYSDSSDDDDNNPTLTQAEQDHRIQEEKENQEIKQLLLNPDELKKRISYLLKKVRKLIKMINKSSLLTTFVRAEIKRRQIDLDININSTNEKKIKVNDLVNDFYIRWNSTFIMLARFSAAEQLVNDITYSPPSHIGLTVKQITKLRSLQNNHLQWKLIKSLADVLAPFYFATKCLSGRQYPTLSLSYWTTNFLFLHLTNEKLSSPLENGLKKLLFDKLTFYFKTNATYEQQCAKLIAAYLDPFTLQDLSLEETNEAESIIMRSTKDTSYAKKSTTTIASQYNQSQSVSSASSSSTDTLQQSKLSTINRFRMLCRSSSSDADTAPKPKPKPKAFTLKQEFSYHISSSTSCEDFQTYWNENKNRLPILSSYARRYNCVPTTSTASESAFSVAGYIDRKQRASLSTTTLRYLMLLKP
ncbi:unnamed protein product [Adineta steineri]|uniref:HAT C-terminal dimerisation domain-containing protein n=1 Tax=Adineta steineri TaxID=433720 RepID=A0A815DKV5_9BILA|nr:unnamed protein product [Adineta steineri]CAF4054301.1 unnamed protein product [Adineta steineri]